jgi:hypothetical protein
MTSVASSRLPNRAIKVAPAMPQRCSLLIRAVISLGKYPGASALTRIPLRESTASLDQHLVVVNGVPVRVAIGARPPVAPCRCDVEDGVEEHPGGRYGDLPDPEWQIINDLAPDDCAAMISSAVCEFGKIQWMSLATPTERLQLFGCVGQ